MISVKLHSNYSCTTSISQILQFHVSFVSLLIFDNIGIVSLVKDSMIFDNIGFVSLVKNSMILDLESKNQRQRQERSSKRQFVTEEVELCKWIKNQSQRVKR